MDNFFVLMSVPVASLEKLRALKVSYIEKTGERMVRAGVAGDVNRLMDLQEILVVHSKAVSEIDEALMYHGAL